MKKSDWSKWNYFVKVPTNIDLHLQDRTYTLTYAFVEIYAFTHSITACSHDGGYIHKHAHRHVLM